MKCLPLLLLTLLLRSALGSSPPAPVNLTVHSVNFHHVLRWDPGPGTPPGTQYLVYKITEKKKGHQLKLLKNSTTSSVQLRLKDQRAVYSLTVVAWFNNTRSAESSRCRFIPYEETKIDPPTVSLSGCGTCLNVNISLPRADSSSGVDIHSFFRPKYRVFYKRRGEKQTTYDTERKRFTLPNLHSATEYCVQVHPMIYLNKNTKPSAWTCTFTSKEEPNTGPLTLAAVGVAVIFVVGGLMASMFLLFYMGFICKLKATLPTALLASLSRGYVINPERTIPDLVSISPGVGSRKHNGPSSAQPAESSDEEEAEEEHGVNIYVVRDAELSSNQSPRDDSCGMSAAARYSGSLAAEDQECGDECKGEGAEGSEEQVEEHVIEEMLVEVEDVVFDNSGDVNLFSVILGALADCDEEEQNSEDHLKWTDLQPLLLHDVTAERTPEGFQPVPDQKQEEEEEEEEEFSGYLGHA